MTEFALYVHWPFCKSKCPYCDFNSHVRASIDEARWRAALLKDLEHYATLTRGRSVTSIFFGGGTPSLMSAETVGAVLERAAALWRFEPDIEICRWQLRPWHRPIVARVKPLTTLMSSVASIACSSSPTVTSSQRQTTVSAVASS